MDFQTKFLFFTHILLQIALLLFIIISLFILNYCFKSDIYEIYKNIIIILNTRNILLVFKSITRKIVEFIDINILDQTGV
jgi:hypothetical protein